MKTILLAFCLVASARLSAQNGAPGTAPPKIDESNSSAFAMGLLPGETRPLKKDADLFSKLFSAIEKKDYLSFVSDGEPQFRALPEDKFNSVAAQLGPRFSADHQVTYLGSLRQTGYRITLWKVSFKDGSDDMLATLSVRSGKIGGFFIK